MRPQAMLIFVVRTYNSIHADPEEAVTAGERARKNDSEPIRVLKPERDEEEEESFSPGGGDEVRTESWTDGPVSRLNPGRGLLAGQAPITTEAEIAADVLKERRSGQASHVLPSQLRTTAETGHGEAGICF
ncbi:hypothetical protein NDU88_008721 [Pleurodeles waltl]|uniref:Uncharacterized protein n=1 Tax=Pleurodeles waltl TaxID=8319 RepID=A0AAV7QPG1_PLEWA|nr:hypothetical protein NDU88_008721 [Pleurodeles waltl]